MDLSQIIEFILSRAQVLSWHEGQHKSSLQVSTAY
jgi:hypothetical protein